MPVSLPLDWEEYDWTNDKGQISHLAYADIRRWVYLSSLGFGASAGKAFKGASAIGSTPIRFANSWTDTLYDYPDVDLDYTGGSDPTNQERNCEYPYYAPGEWTVWFERSFSHSIQGVVLTGSDYEFKFSATNIQKYGIYDQNGTTIDIDGDLESWYEEEDDLRPGTPFEATGTNAGFYRVRSVRQSGSNVYVIADGIDDYTQKDLTIQGAGGSATCDFGPGDWYTFRGAEGNSTTDFRGVTNEGLTNGQARDL